MVHKLIFLTPVNILLIVCLLVEGVVPFGTNGPLERVLCKASLICQSLSLTTILVTHNIVGELVIPEGKEIDEITSQLGVSTRMLFICSESLVLPLQLIFTNILTNRYIP